ncbi:hypothetical protein GGI05_002126, partial [Coemansia sp. RSA 2603]
PAQPPVQPHRSPAFCSPSSPSTADFGPYGHCNITPLDLNFRSIFEYRGVVQSAREYHHSNRLVEGFPKN